MKVDDFRDHWEGSLGRYVLARVTEGDNGLLIIDQENRMVEIIDDDEVYAEVVRRMLDAGIAIVERPG
jgi:hypothetical protein